MVQMGSPWPSATARKLQLLVLSSALTPIPVIDLKELLLDKVALLQWLQETSMAGQVLDDQSFSPA